MAHSKPTAPARKARSPRIAAMGLPDDFPLFPLGSDDQPERLRWAKKVRGKLHYFGRVADDPRGEAALALWNEQQRDLLAGRKPRPKPTGDVTLADVINGFLNKKKLRIESGELKLRTWEGYFDVGKMLTDHFGRERLADDLGPDDFQELRAAMAKRWKAPVALANRIQVVRMIFRWGVKSERLPCEPRYGDEFDKPSAKVIREAREKKGARMFAPEQIKQLLAHAPPGMKAMILLGINGGLSNADLGALTAASIDFEGGWLNYPRAKTAIKRRIPLWPETLDAIKLVMACRPQTQDAGPIFVGGRGREYHRGWRISAEFADLAKRAKVKGRQFYDLRRTFQTIGENARDLVAVSSIMGHGAASGDMSSVYRQKVDDERLRAVVAVVRAWLYPPEPEQQEKPARGRNRRPVAEPQGELRVVG